MTDLPIFKPGVYDLDAEVYHADPVAGGSLSSSGARRLLATCPARFRYELDHPRASTASMDLGTAAHRLVLGVGPELVEVEAKDWRTKAAQDERDEARARGAVPLLSKDFAAVHAMADALRRHELASALLGGPGRAEQTLIWRDGPTAVWRRALVDWLARPEPTGLMYLADYKTSESAHPAAISKAIANYGYHGQGAWYGDGVIALGLAAEVAFFLVVQEKTEPYLVTPVQLNQLALDAGRHENRKALELYARCRATDTWPAYVDGIEPVGLPGWAENRFLQEVTS
ncbi:PD-(D/E)XK nuclease-like domain-containing protein [Actinomadura harenae]|uniref:PD-(D/E)XK nuclease-like domain-containing protein n=1 Tax=Actinomadura harenae TaxID=2483351 RepID=UPI0018F2A15F|nr:PD-(D/E)XK nuclease-like domain-containing protein [Actinomadura harenae]